MRKFVSVVCTLVLVLSLTGTAGAASFTFEPDDGGGNPTDLWDLEHGKYYTWGIDMDVQEGEEIVGASLSFNDIRNWRTEVNDLWVNLLDSAPEGATQYGDSQSGQVNAFDGQGILLNQWEDLPSTAQDITYQFDSSELGFLMDYIANDGKFGLGFDPDCHFYNNGISLTIETAAITSQVPEPSTMFLLGCGLIGLAGLGRKRLKK